MPAITGIKVRVHTVDIACTGEDVLFFQVGLIESKNISTS